MQILTNFVEIYAIFGVFWLIFSLPSANRHNIADVFLPFVIVLVIVGIPILYVLTCICEWITCEINK